MVCAQANSNSASISTGMSNGSSARPTALRGHSDLWRERGKVMLRCGLNGLLLRLRITPTCSLGDTPKSTSCTWGDKVCEEGQEHTGIARF